MAPPRKKLTTQDVLNAILESSDEDEPTLSDSDDAYEPSDSDSSDSSLDKPEQSSAPLFPLPLLGDEYHRLHRINAMEENAALQVNQQPFQSRELDEPLQLPAPLSPLPPLEDEQYSPRLIAMEENTALSMNQQQPATELPLTYCTDDELPLPPTPSPLPSLSDTVSDDFPLPPPPSPFSSLDDDEDFTFPPPPSPITLTNDTTTPKKLTRKRQRKEQTWKKKVHSNKHNTGQEKFFKGKSIERKMRPLCREDCQRMCRENFSEKKRQQIFDTYWGMNSKQGRRDFVVSHVNEEEKKRSVGKSDRRKRTLTYRLPSDGSSVQVCKKMFLATLDISDIMVLYNLKQSVCNVVHPKPKPEPKNKIPQNMIDTVKKHIESFPKVESHYCRADSKREYLDASLNLRQMYRLYCQDETIERRVSEHKYREIFNTQYNLAFHHPSKDVCDTCSKFKLIISPSEAEIESHESHLRRKIQAREHKDADKSDLSKIVAAFDLQQVISCPKLSVSNAYYLRKLNIYNFTILNLQNLQGDCYPWTEYECNRGTNDIASCVLMWLREKDNEGAKHVVFYSDCCGGQNRNRIMIAAVSKFLTNSQSIVKIEQKFFESGHSKNECDSMHSAIQNHYSKSDVFLPSGFHEHMKQAHHSKPYNIHNIMHSEIFDFGKLNADHMKATAFSGIQKVHHIIYEKDSNNVNIYFSEEIGVDPQVKPFLKRGHTQATFRNANVSLAYDGPSGIDNDKKDDLLRLCHYMPEDCKVYYNSLL